MNLPNTVRLCFWGGRKRPVVPARVHGTFAAHHACDDQGERVGRAWQVSHVPTGGCLMFELPSLWVADAFARGLEERVGGCLDWCGFGAPSASMHCPDFLELWCARAEVCAELGLENPRPIVAVV